MSEKLFLYTIRYLAELYERGRLSPEQARTVAEFVVNLTSGIREEPADAKAAEPVPGKRFNVLDVETVRILHDVVPELREALGGRGEGGLIPT